MNRNQTEQGGAEARILQAAMTLFARKGYEGTTTREIAKEAGSSLSMLNLHYGSKEGLYQKTLERVFDVFYFSKLTFYQEILKVRQEHPDDREVNRDLLERYTGMIIDTVLDPENREAVLILNRAFLNPDQDFRKIEPMLMLFMNLELLLLSSAGWKEASAPWAKEFSFQMISSMFSHVNYPSVAEFLNRDEPTEPSEVRRLVKEYQALSIAAVLSEYSKR